LNDIFLIYNFHKNKRGESISELADKLKDSWVSDWRADVATQQGKVDANSFDGVLFITAHGSKGLQFDNVLIHKDFQFDKLLGNLHDGTFADSAYVREQAHHIYVAITRAKVSLYLSSKASEFIESLRKATPKDEKVPGSTVDLSNEREDMEKAWALFVADPTSTISTVEDIPWPIGDDQDNPFSLDCFMSLDDRKTAIKAALLRYHPDQFLSRLGTRREGWSTTLRKRRNYGSDYRLLLSNSNNNCKCSSKKEFSYSLSVVPYNMSELELLLVLAR